jgi:hypothetical protein
MTRPKEPRTEPGEVPYVIRIEQAIEAYNNKVEEGGRSLFRRVRREFAVSWVIIRDCIYNGARSKEVEA